MKILISLHKGYGLGDGVQMSAVLRHVAKHRPQWNIYYQAEEGKHQVARGIAPVHFAYNSPERQAAPYFDAEVQICLYDTWANWGDRPNTRVSSALHEHFDLSWEPELGRYQVNVREESLTAASAMIHGLQRGGTPRCRLDRKYVAVHYQGDSSQVRKNLLHNQADGICKAIEDLGYVPIILDWRQRCPLEYRRLRELKEWGGDAEMVCAVIRQCEAFVGIDSGPSKCASSTGVPSLVIWTGHHPAPFHDPAPNTTHLVPLDYHGLEPVCNNKAVIDWFEQHYKVRQYKNCLVTEACKWLEETLL